MFLENNIYHPEQSGWIEVICGSMFSGKTEELIRRLKRAQLAGLKVEVFKPKIDNRYHEEEVVSHDKNALQAQAVESSSNIPLLCDDAQVVGLDEAQFFDDGIVRVANELANAGKRVIIAGLDMDFKGRPFGPMPQLMAVAEYVTKVHAICKESGHLAHHSFRKTETDALVELGEKEEYEAVSRNVFWKRMNQKKEK